MKRKPASVQARSGIICPLCGQRTRVLNTERRPGGIIRRRRVCVRCDCWAWTEEKALEWTQVKVIEEN